MSGSVPPLDGVRVLDLSTEIAGPYASKMLVDAGAEVIKVERPEGDPLRSWSSSGQSLGDRDGALFQFLNGGKQSVVWDLAKDAGRDAFLRACTTVDLVIEDGVGPTSLASAGLSFEALRAVNPALSLVSVSPFGSEGPWADRPATEFTMQAEIGNLAYRGLPDRGPVAAGGRINEWGSGAAAAVACLATWRSARASGVGLHADLAMFEVASLCLTTYHDLFGQFVPGYAIPQAIETPSIEPCKDGWIGLCTYTAQQWRDLCVLIGRPEVGEDPLYHDGTARMAHLDFIQPIIHGWTKEQTMDEVTELVGLMRIPVAPIGDGRNVLEFDQFRERAVFEPHPDGFTAPRTPYRLHGATQPGFRAAPRLGADTSPVEATLPEAAPARPAPAGGARPAFEGLRVVDLTAFWAGPFATGMLAALGADVIKVESIQRPDGMRYAGAVPSEVLWETCPIFQAANLSKRGITLNLDSEEGKALLRRLLEEADVVIENFSARVMENFGFTWDVLHEINPRLVSVRMPAWGLDGPWKDRTGFAPNVEQASGLAWLCGYRDMPLIPRGVCDPVGGMHTVFALAMGLEERDRTGEGLLVEVPLVEPALNMAAEQVIEWTAYGAFLERTENRGPGASPQAVFACRPSATETRYEKTHLAISVTSDAQWATLVELIGHPEWAAEAAYATEGGRRAAEDEIESRLGAWFADQDCDEIAERLCAAGIPASALINGYMLSPNVQIDARGFRHPFTHPVSGDALYPGLPFTLSEETAAVYAWVAPTLGQHNEEVLSELGVSADEIAALAEKQVIGTRPSFED